MLSVYYLLRSRDDGRYLVAHPRLDPESTPPSYLLMFREDFDALSYLNTHGADLKNRFAVESMTIAQIKNLTNRWGFSGVGIVQDPLLPKVEFLSHF